MKDRFDTGWLRSIGAGTLWLMILFVTDLIDSYYLLGKATKRVKHDQATTDIIVQEVAIYLSQVSVGYLFLGLVAGVWIHFFMRLWQPKQLERLGWWKTVVLFCTTSTFWFYWYQIVTMPTIHDWLPKELLYTISDGSTPSGVLFYASLWSGGLLFLSFLRWRTISLLHFFQRLLAFSAWTVLWTWLFQYPTAPAPTKNEGTNIVVIGIDGLRPDHLQRNGYLRNTAPNIEKLMEESIVFSNAYTVLPRTYPSWSSILTGQYPINNGIRDNIISDLIPQSKTITQAFQEKQWHSSFVTDDSRFSFMQKELGFDDIVQPQLGAMNFALSAAEPRFRAFHLLMHNPLGYWLAPVIAHNQALGKSYRPELFFEANIEALTKAAQHERFFFTTHACFLHAPGDRNYPWSQMYDQNGYKGKNRLRYSKSGTKLVFNDGDDDAPINTMAEQDYKIYDSGIAMADGLVARIVGALKESGLYDNSIIILLSDHGENLWVPNTPYRWHGPNHGFHPYGIGQHKVVFSIHFPEKEIQPTQIDSPIRLIDLAPTLAEYFQLEWGDDIDGKSLLPLIRGETEQEPREVYIETGMSEPNYWPPEHRTYSYKRIAERYWIRPDNHWVLVRDEFLPELIQGKDRIMQLEDWRLVWRPNQDREPTIELFDNVADPENQNDISVMYPVHVAHLGMRLWPYLERDDEDFTAVEQWKKIVARYPEPDWKLDSEHTFVVLEELVLDE